MDAHVDRALLARHRGSYVAPAQWRLAELHEWLGDRGRAIASLRRFVTLWQDAEPELRPLVVDARRALARLTDVSPMARCEVTAATPPR